MKNIFFLYRMVLLYFQRSVDKSIPSHNPDIALFLFSSLGILASANQRPETVTCDQWAVVLGPSLPPLVGIVPSYNQ